MVEWYDVTNLISYKLGSTDIIFYIGTTDKERNRTLSVHLYDVRDRQFSFTFLVNDTTNWYDVTPYHQPLNIGYTQDKLKDKINMSFSFFLSFLKK